MYKADCDSNDCELTSGQATPFSSSTILMHERRVVLSLFTLLAWFPNSSHSNAIVTPWFTSLRTFGASCTWLGGGRFTFDLKYQWILISTIDSWTWLYRTVQMRTCVEHLSKRDEVMCNIIHCVFFSCDSFDCEVWKSSQFAMKRILQSKPVLQYCMLFMQPETLSSWKDHG